MPSDFVHLHVHTQYSLLDGACRLQELMRRTAEAGMPAVAMTDHGNLFGAVSFYQAAVKHGIKPIIGCEAYLAPAGRRNKGPDQPPPFHLTLFARDETGYRNLLRLVSASYLEGFYYRPRIDKDLLQDHADGLSASSGCLRGEVPSFLKQGDYAAALKAADDYRHIFGPGHFFLEVMDHGLPEQGPVNEGLMKIGRELDLPLLVTNDVHYIDRSQARAHEVLLCIQTQSFLNDPNRMRLQSDQFYLKSPEEMARAFSWIPEGLRNTRVLADQCRLELRFDEYHLPRYDPPGGGSREAFLRELCRRGVAERYGDLTPEVSRRLEHELAVIEKMGFVSYFLIVWDFIHYARREGIPVGPGRGSAAGSLVSYLLGITDLDPLKYGLLFERFLNPDRSGMPDIDIDFCFERRPEVIAYVTRKYGEENVAQIITFGTMQARAAVRDVGRVLGVPYADVDRLAKLIPAELGMTLERALEIEPQLKELCAKDPTAAEVVETARVLEGLNRHASIHAAGVVISDKPLTEYVPLFKSTDGQVTTGFSMDGIAKIGLLKMDFLGLRTLTVIDRARQWVERTRGEKIDVGAVPLDDPKTFTLLAQANTFGVFQLESSGMRDLLKKIRPSRFEDLISILALYRPGPMGSGMLEDFIRRKHGDVPVEYPHPKLEPVLKETFGIIVYQEQVMQMASVLAGFSMTEADHLRRAMSKKISSVMERMRRSFVEGCGRESGIPPEEADRLFDLIDYFSGYGFNRSHSAAYALISYQTAYLKANYPVEFMCALLTSEKDNTDKVVEYVKECRQMGIEVLPPDVNASEVEFSVVDERRLRFGLLAVKNVGQSAIESIVATRRRDGPFHSLYEFCERVDLRLVNRKVLESLIKCGAFDGLGFRRAQLMMIAERALELGGRTQQERQAGQISFFALEGDTGGFRRETEQIPDIREWPRNQLLSYEKELLGFYISGHPLERYRTEIETVCDGTTADLRQAADGQEVKLIGIIHAVRLTTTRKSGERMAILRIEDMEGEVEAVVFPSVYGSTAPLLKEGEVVIVIGRVAVREESPNIIVNDLKRIDDLFRLVKEIHLDLPDADADRLRRIKDALRRFPGPIPVFVNLPASGHRGVRILVGKGLHVAPGEMLVQEMRELVGDRGVTLSV